MEAIINNRKKLINDYLLIEQQLPPEAFAFVEEPDRTSDGLPKFEVTFDVYEECAQVLKCWSVEVVCTRQMPS